MFDYGIGILLPLICWLKDKSPLVKQPWYAIDVGATSGSLSNLCKFFERL
jgi:hypothetical protein